MKTNLRFENIGCEELQVTYGFGKFYWTPSTGLFRVSGQSPICVLKNRREVISWILARREQFI